MNAYVDSSALGALIDQFERTKASIRAKVEHPFRVLKQQFGYVKVRYRGLKKNTAQIVTLFAQGNLWMARHKLMACLGPSLSRCCPRSLFEDTSGGQLLASHSASHVSPRLFLLGAALGRGNTARVDLPCQAQQMLRNLLA